MANTEPLLSESAPTEFTPPPGALERVGQYRLVRPLGAGGMSQVYLALDSQGSEVALKVVQPSDTEPGLEARLQREGELLATIDNPHVVQVLEHGQDESRGCHFLALELVRGLDLAALVAMQADRRLPARQVFDLLDQVASGLHALHATGIVHRDVKPANVLLTREGMIKLADLGIGFRAGSSLALTATNEVVGTTAYMSPELLRGETPTPAADVYSLGIVAYSLLHGEHPFAHVPPANLADAQIHAPPPSFSEIVPALDPALVALLDRTLAKEPAGRPELPELQNTLALFLPTVSMENPFWAQAAAQIPLQQSMGLRPGTDFHHFRLRRELGRGGMGVVYEAEHLRLAKTVALKVMLSGALATDLDRKRFLKESEAAGQLRHPAIVSVLDAGEADGTYYLTMDYVPGRPFSEVLRNEREAFGRKGLLRLFERACEGIEHAHSRGVIHRDLKPDNILIDEEGQPRVLDFGLAKRLDADGQSALTNAGDLMGTLRYMPPEQAMGKAHEVDARSDVYALGIVLYEILCGRTPFVGSTYELLDKVRSEEPAPPSTFDPSVPWELDAICLKAIEKDPNDRYDSARALREDVASYLEMRPISARKTTATQRLRKWGRRNRAVALRVLILALVALVGLSLSGLYRTQREREFRERSRAAIGALSAGDFDAATQGLAALGSSMSPEDAFALDADLSQRLADVGLAQTSTREDDPNVSSEDVTAWLEVAHERGALEPTLSKLDALSSRVWSTHAQLAQAKATCDELVRYPFVDERSRRRAFGLVRIVALSLERHARKWRAEIATKDQDVQARLDAGARVVEALTWAVWLRDSSEGKAAAPTKLDEELEAARKELSLIVATRDNASAAGASELLVRRAVAPADGASTAELDVRLLRKEQGSDELVPWVAQSVRLSATPNAELADTKGDHVSDEEGRVRFALRTTRAGVYVISATVNPGNESVVLSRKVKVTFTACAPVASRSMVELVAAKSGATPSKGAQRGLADGKTALRARVTLADRYGNRVPRSTLTLALSGSGAQVEPRRGATNAEGVFEADLRSSVAEIKTLTCVIEAPEGATTLRPLPVTFAAGAPSAAGSKLSAAPVSLTADAAAVTTLTVTVRDASGNAVPGVALAISATGKGNALRMVSSETSTQGVAIGTLRSSVAEVKTISVTARIGGKPVVLATQRVTFHAGPLAHDSCELSLEAGAIRRAVVNLRDRSGNPIPGLKVKLELLQEEGSQTLLEDVTDGRGQVRAPLSPDAPKAPRLRATVFTKAGPVRLVNE